MGVFTSIRHPVDGREIQIKTGDDVCAWYNVGDELPKPDFSFIFGHKLDGVYEGCCYPDGKDCWVVVKNAKIVHVEDTAVDIFGSLHRTDQEFDELDRAFERRVALAVEYKVPQK